MRKFLIAGGVLLSLLALGAAVVLGPFYFRVRHFSADPSEGYLSDFYVYVSPAAKEAVRAGALATLLIQPNNSGTNSDDIDVHRKDAWWTTFGRSRVADELGVVLLVPAFPRPATDWKVYTHALDRDVFTTTRPELARLDLQLLAMVDAARAKLAREGMASDPRFLIQGFSASGMFADRFAALHPERVKAVAAGSPGGWPIAPATEWHGESLPYPAGVSDLRQLTGKPFDAQAYRAIPKLIVMGSLDDNDSLDFRDGWDEQAAVQVDRLFGKDPQSRWNASRQLHETAGANTSFLLVPGVGHDRRKLQVHSTRLFARVLADERAGVLAR